HQRFCGILSLFSTNFTLTYLLSDLICQPRPPHCFMGPGHAFHHALVTLGNFVQDVLLHACWNQYSPSFHQQAIHHQQVVSVLPKALSLWRRTVSFPPCVDQGGQLLTHWIFFLCSSY